MSDILNTYSRRHMLKSSGLLIGSVASSNFLPIRALAAERPIEEQIALDTQVKVLPVSERKRVLLINNEPPLRSFVEDYLEFYIGCETITVEDTKDVLKVLEQEQELPNLIVDTMCLHFEYVSRNELLSFMKQNERTCKIPFLSFSCFPPCKDSFNKIKRLNPNIYLVVTRLAFESEELLVQVKSLLKAEA